MKWEKDKSKVKMWDIYQKIYAPDSVNRWNRMSCWERDIYISEECAVLALHLNYVAEFENTTTLTEKQT